MASSVLEYIRTTAEADPKTALDLALAENERLAAEAKATAEVSFGPEGLQATNLSGVWRMARAFVQAGLSPEGSKNKAPEDRIAEAVVAIAYGREIGLSALQAVQNVMVVNGRPTIYGDAAKALVLKSPVCDYVREWAEGTGDDYAWICEAKRKGQEPERTKFGVKEAKQARLWGKTGPWTFYPGRMLMFRARGFRLRDTFPDVLKGLLLFEEHDADVTVTVGPAGANHEVGTRTERLTAKLTEQATPPAPELPETAETETEPHPEQAESPAVEEPQATRTPDAIYDQAQVAVIQEYRTLANIARTADRLNELGGQAGIDPRLRASAKMEIQKILDARMKELTPVALPPRRGRPPKGALYPDQNMG